MVTMTLRIITICDHCECMVLSQNKMKQQGYFVQCHTRIFAYPHEACILPKFT